MVPGSANRVGPATEKRPRRPKWCEPVRFKWEDTIKKDNGRREGSRPTVDTHVRVDADAVDERLQRRDVDVEADDVDDDDEDVDDGAPTA